MMKSSVVAQVVSQTPSPVFMGTMTTNKEDKRAAKLAKVTTSETMERPKQDPERSRLLTQTVSIDGRKAFSLFDTGCTTAAMSNDFATVGKMRLAALNKPVDMEFDVSVICRFCG